MAFVVLIEQPLGSGKHRRARIVPLTEDDEICQFETAAAAKAATKGHHWEHVWSWYVVELADGATVEGC
jgi:hypothetical protein